MDDKRLKILFISSWYPNKNRPYLGIFVKRHAEAVAQTCHVAAVFASSNATTEMDVKTENGVFTINSYYKKPNLGIPVVGKLLRLYRYLGAWRKAIKQYEKENGKPDIIHANIVFPASVFAMWYSFVWRVPYLITEHWSGYFPKDGRYKGFFMKMVSRITVSKASAVVTVSKALKENMLKEKLVNTYYVISNIVDTNTFTAAPQIHSNTIRFIHVSSPDGDRKNVPGIIKAFKVFHASCQDSTLTLIVGKGEEVDVLKELCVSHKLESSVSFLDLRPKEELAKVLHNCDAFVLFSDVETQGVVLLEALCCGLPVISSRCGAPEDFITPKNGLLVDARNEEQLIAAMNTFAKNKNNYKPEEVRNSIFDMVNEKSINREFLQVYQNILNQK